MGCEEFMESIPKATDPPPVLSVLDEAALVALGPNLVARIVRGENVLPSGSASAERVDEKRAARVEADLAASCFECESSPCVCHFTLLAPQERAGVLAAVRAQEVAREAKPKGPPRHRWSGIDPITCSRCGRVKGPQAGTCPGSREAP